MQRSFERDFGKEFAFEPEPVNYEVELKRLNESRGDTEKAYAFGFQSILCFDIVSRKRFEPISSTR